MYLPSLKFNALFHLNNEAWKCYSNTIWISISNHLYYDVFSVYASTSVAFLNLIPKFDTILWMISLGIAKISCIVDDLSSSKVFGLPGT
jgi:hypothetical protein